MAKQRDTSWVDELFDFFAEVPWWVGPPFAFVLFVLARWIFPWITTATMSSDELGEGAANTLTMLSIRLAPLVAGVVIAIWLVAIVVKLVRRPRAVHSATDVVKATRKSPAAPTAAHPHPAPSCPKCGAAMVRRVAKTGQFKGQPFFGCTRFPECRGTRARDAG